MATQWYWRERETQAEKGPISFQDLVGLVRDHHLDEDDLVRPHYTRTWQTTDSVVGLYPMAQRIPVPRDPEPVADSSTDPAESDPVHVRRYRLDEVTHDEDAAAGALAASSGGGSVIGMDDLEAMLAAVPENETDGAIPPSWNGPGGSGSEAGYAYGGGSSGNWDSIMQAAVDHVDARAEHHEQVESPRGWRGRLIAIRRLVSHPEAARQLFRLAVAIACCVAFGYWAVNYSAYEMSRFPSREMVQQDLRFFPFIGTCEASDYWALLCLSAVALGALAYRGAMEVEQRWLEFD